MSDRIGHHLPPLSRCDVQVFNVLSHSGTGNTTPLTWTTWTRPSGVAMLYIRCVGGGGSGGAGANASPGGGGGGGGSGGMTNLIIPAIFLPSVLYVQVGGGGLQGGGQGYPSAVSLYPDLSFGWTDHNIVCTSNRPTFPAAGGSNGGAGTGGAGAGGGAAARIQDMPVAGAGIFTFIAGQTGAAGGGTGANGGNVTPPLTGTRATGGAGGGCAHATVGLDGGGFVSVAATLINDARPAVSTADSEPGCGGPYLPYAGDFSFGGTGGGGGINVGGTTGGPGGAGGIGAGGGGGGGGYARAGGPGGRGGNGMVTIIAW